MINLARPFARIHAPQQYFSFIAASHILFALICVLLFSMLGWQRWDARQAQIKVAEMISTNLAHAVAEHVQDSLDKANLVLSDFVAIKEMEDIQPDIKARLQEILATRVRELPVMQNLIVLDEQGQRTFANLTLPGQSRNNSDRAYFRFHRDNASRGPYVGMPIRARSTGAWAITVSRRINHGDGSFAGVALSTIALDFFDAYYAQFDIGVLGQILLLDSERGSIMTLRPFQDSLLGQVADDASLFGRGANNGSGVLVSPQDGVKRIVGARKLDQYPLLVSVGVAESEVLSSWRAGTFKYLSVLSLLLAILILQRWNLVRQTRLRARSDRMLHAISDSLPMLINYTDMEQRYRFVNLAYQGWTGRTLDQISGLTVLELIGPEAYERTRMHVEAALKGNASIHQFKTIAYGAPRQVRVQYVPQFDRHGQVEGTVTVITDISEYQAIQQTLLQAQQSLMRAQAIAHVGSWEYELATGKIAWSDETYRIQGHALSMAPTWAAAIGAVHPDDAARVSAVYLQAIDAATGFQVAFRLLRFDGSVRHVIDQAEVVRDDDGVALRLIGALVDVTERKMAELAALDARERELKIGFNIQQALLMADVPSELDGAWISTHVEPSQGLHGDFIAISRQSSTRFCLLVGDVMGKGIHAAMIGAGIKNAFYQVLAELLAQAIDTRMLPDPATIINALHRKVTPQLISMDCFVTLALYVFDAQAGTVAVVNAGHTEGLLLRMGSRSVEAIAGENLPLGVLADEVYVQRVLAIADDDHLVVYSDGISEVCNQHGEEFGSAGIAAWLLRSCQANLPGDEALQQLRQQLAQFRSSSRMVDDQTVVMIRLRAVCQLAPSTTSAADGFLCSFDI
jgi:PAS domain S-box-containing protein